MVRAASTGSVCAARASRTAAPSRSASVSVAGTSPSVSWSPRITVSALEIWQPSSTQTARAMRSAAWLETASTMMLLPLSSASAIGVSATSTRSRTFWSIRGKALPIESASSSGSPSRAAQATATQPLRPPISLLITAATGAPCSASKRSGSRAGSSRPPIRSAATAGDPTSPTGMTSASAGSAAGRRRAPDRTPRSPVRRRGGSHRRVRRPLIPGRHSPARNRRVLRPPCA